MRVVKNIVLGVLVVCLLCPMSPAQTQPRSAKPDVRSRPQIKSRAEFDALSRINTDAGYPLPHVMYAIDRKDKNKN